MRFLTASTTAAIACSSAERAEREGGQAPVVDDPAEGGARGVDDATEGSSERAGRGGDRVERGVDDVAEGLRAAVGDVEAGGERGDGDDDEADRIGGEREV